MNTLPADSEYPAALDIDYPDRPLNRLSTFSRVFTIIPIAIVLIVSGALLGLVGLRPLKILLGVAVGVAVAVPLRAR